MGVGRGAGAALGAAGGVLAAEMCAPLLLLCWLCCWPEDASDSSSTGHPRKPVITSGTESKRRRAREIRGRLAGSAVSLHIPGPSGSPCLPAHRSHEELPGRYCSEPGVLGEVLRRRDWDRSARDLHIPLHPDPDTVGSIAPRASPESDDQETPRCKKHHSNIKSSRGKEQRAAPPERDEESPSRFYIGDEERAEDKPSYPEKEEKQCLNESIRSKERPWRFVAVDSSEFLALDPPDRYDPDQCGQPELGRSDPFHPDQCGQPELGRSNRFHPDQSGQPELGRSDRFHPDQPGQPELGRSDRFHPDQFGYEPDRSGAMHHALDSRAEAMGYGRIVPLSPISVDVVDYEYSGAHSESADRCAALRGSVAPTPRARHASDGDILAPAPRPESGAFSESDVDLELRLALQAEELQQLEAHEGTELLEPPPPDRRETAI